jgi:hypothetical protein
MPLNFIGNVEGRDLYSGKVDVIVADGFVGNVALKTSEGVANLVRYVLKESLRATITRQVGYLLSRSAFAEFKKRFDYSEYGGAPLLGAKRFTWLCHVWLGLSVAWAPFGAYVAVAGKVTWESLVLVGIITLWNAGFDVPYATQDMEADIRNGVHSIPARFGLVKSLQFARYFHLGVVALVLLFGFVSGLVTGLNPLAWTAAGWTYMAGWVAVAGLLHYEHSLISPQDMSKLGTAFFNVNALVSFLYFLFTATALVLS